LAEKKKEEDGATFLEINPDDKDIYIPPLATAVSAEDFPYVFISTNPKFFEIAFDTQVLEPRRIQCPKTATFLYCGITRDEEDAILALEDFKWMEGLEGLTINGHTVMTGARYAQYNGYM